MSRDTLERDAALRRLLVAQATRHPRSFPWPALVGSVAVAAMLAGVAIGATAFRAPGDPQVGVTPADPALPWFISDESTVVGTPMTIRTSEAVAYEAGDPPVGATGLAVWVDCAEGGTFASEIDGRPDLGGDCFETGGGYVRFAPFGPNVVRVTPSGGPATITVAWIARWNDITPGAEVEAALADGVVTEEEYRAGFDRFAACMELWGAPILGSQWVNDRYFYTTSGDHRMYGALHECYGTEFEQLDIAWQVAHPQQSDEQVAALIDGVVTREEYLASYDRWAACLTELGASVQVLDREAEVLDHAVDAGFASSADVSLCYRREFFNVESAWKAEH